MKIETQPLDDHQVKIIAEIENERMDEMKRRAAAKLARRIKIPGFRPGKAPYPVIQRTVGEAAIFEEALELLVDTVYPEVIEQANIKPYGPGRLDNVAEMNPLKLEFVVPLDAVVKLGDYKAIRIPYEPKPISESDIQESLESLRERQAVLEPAERPAIEGDVVTLSLSADFEKDGNKETLLEERSIPLILRSDDEHEWPFQGFSMNLIGKAAGDSDSLEYTFPSDYADDSLKGVLSHFHYQVENIKSRTLPELNDEFATIVGEFENMEALVADIRAKLELQAEEVLNETYDNELLDLAIDQAEFKYAPQMLEDEINQVITDLKNRVERQGLDIDIYLKSRNMDEKGLREEVKPAAEKRLKRSLLLFELGQVEDIQVEREELETEAGSTLQYLQRVLPEKESRQLKKTEVQNNIVNNVLVDLLSRKSIQRLRDYARGRIEQNEIAETPVADDISNNVEGITESNEEAMTADTSE